MGPSAAVAHYDGDDDNLVARPRHAPLAPNVAEMLFLDPEKVVCHHRQGPGCYGHNGADDAAADAAIVALSMPGETILQWRREEEFAYEPVSPAMSVTVRVAVDADDNPADWTQEIWSATHVQRPGSGSGYLLASEALENPPPPVKSPTRRWKAAAVAPAMPFHFIRYRRTASSITW